MEPLFLTSGTLIHVIVLYYDGFNTKPVCKSNALLRPIWMKKAVHLNEESRFMLRANADCLTESLKDLDLDHYPEWPASLHKGSTEPKSLSFNLKVALMLESNMCGTLFQISEQYICFVFVNKRRFSGDGCLLMKPALCPEVTYFLVEWVLWHKLRIKPTVLCNSGFVTHPKAKEQRSCCVWRFFIISVAKRMCLDRHERLFNHLVF